MNPTNDQPGDFPPGFTRPPAQPADQPAAQPGAQPGKRRRRLRQLAIGGAGAVLALGGTSAWALNRYVIDHVRVSDVTAYEQANSAANSAANSVTDSSSGNTTNDSLSADSLSADSLSADSLNAGSQSTDSQNSQTESTTNTPVTTENSYTDGSTTITIKKVTTGTGDDTITYFVADVMLSEATAVRGGFANNQFGSNITQATSQIAAAQNAIFAINGDYYGFRDTGIVIRNGVIYRDTAAREGLAIYLDGTMRVYDETATTAEQLLADGVWNTLSFGPAIVRDSQIVSGIEAVEVDTNFGNHSIQGEQPRTGIGMVSANHFVFVVADGRSPGYSRGVTMTEFAQIFTDLGASVAYNLDGGGSSTMFFNGSLVNNPLGRNRERGTSDILYIAQG